MLNESYRKFDHKEAEYITVKTIQIIEQKEHKPFENIPLDREQMFQKVIVESYGGHVETIKLDYVMDGFPISPELLSYL